MCDVKRTDAVDEVIGCGHVAPGAEFVDFDTNGMDDVVDAVLHDDCTGACDIHFYRETRGTLEAVGRVGDATVFAQNACAAYGATDDGDIVEPFAGAAEREVIGPVLRRDGIAETDECKILFFSENVNRVEEVNPVCFAGEIIREGGAFRKIAVAILAARKWARNGCTGVHLCEVSEVEAYIKCFACGYVERDFVT